MNWLRGAVISLDMLASPLTYAVYHGLCIVNNVYWCRNSDRYLTIFTFGIHSKIMGVHPFQSNLINFHVVFREIWLNNRLALSPCGWHPLRNPGASSVIYTPLFLYYKGHTWLISLKMTLEYQFCRMFSFDRSVECLDSRAEPVEPHYFLSIFTFFFTFFRSIISHKGTVNNACLPQREQPILLENHWFL